MADQDDIPKTSRTVHMPTSPEEHRRQIRNRIRMQADQTDEERAAGAGARARKTQDWTPFYLDLLNRASREAIASGSSAANELEINRMLALPDPDAPRDPDYRPPAEVMAEMEREAVLEAREQELERREAELAADRLELAARKIREGLKENPVHGPPEMHETYTEDTSARGYGYGVPEHPNHREYGYRPDENAPPPTWASGRRMTAKEREEATAEGLEMFGIDPAAGSVWTTVDPRKGSIASQLPHQEPLARHDRMIGRATEAERIADLANQRLSAEDRHAHEIAEAAIAAEQAPAGAEQTQAERDAEARAYIEGYLRSQRNDY